MVVIARVLHNPFFQTVGDTLQVSYKDFINVPLPIVNQVDDVI
jgi:hypothetical protein